jgi:hypothetical protein
LRRILAEKYYDIGKIILQVLGNFLIKNLFNCLNNFIKDAYERINSCKREV